MLAQNKREGNNQEQVIPGLGSAGIAGDAESAPPGPEMPGQRSSKAEYRRQGIPVTLPADQLRQPMAKWLKNWKKDMGTRFSGAT